MGFRMDYEYLDVVQQVLEYGSFRGDRTGTGTKSLFNPVPMRFDLDEAFPLLTLKRTWFKGVVGELLWFIRGDDNIDFLLDNNIHIWDDWSKEGNSVGPVYGYQWRRWPVHTPGLPPVDQLADVIQQIKENPTSRRLLVSAWNVEQLPDMALPPCHVMYQFYVTNNGHLNCFMYQRSADLFLGVPFNIASYALLTHMVAQVCGLEAGRLTMMLGDAHIYLNHTDQVEEMMLREPRDSPSLVMNTEVKDINEFTFDDFQVVGYDPYPAIPAPIAV